MTTPKPIFFPFDVDIIIMGVGRAYITIWSDTGGDGTGDDALEKKCGFCVEFSEPVDRLLFAVYEKFTVTG